MGSSFSHMPGVVTLWQYSQQGHKPHLSEIREKLGEKDEKESRREAWLALREHSGVYRELRGTPGMGKVRIT